MISNSFFAEKFGAFLLENHPDILSELGNDVDKYINERSEKVNKLFQEELQTGIHTDVALEHAYSVLKEGLLFSKYNTIENILEEYYLEEYQKHTENKDLTKYIIKIIKHCENVFQKYNVSDSFEETRHFEAELIGEIESYIISKEN